MLWKCLLCGRKATHLFGRWYVCAMHHAALVQLRIARLAVEIQSPPVSR